MKKLIVALCFLLIPSLVIAQGFAGGFSGGVSGQPLDADLTTLSGYTVDGTANTVGLINGTAVFNVAPAATLNIDTSLAVQTGAVTLTGNAAGSAVVFPAGSTTFTTPTAAGQFLCASGANVWSNCTTMSSSDSAAQFYSATASKGTWKMLMTSMSDGIMGTFTPICTGACILTTTSYGAGTYTIADLESTQAITGEKTLTNPHITTAILASSAGGATIGDASHEFGSIYLGDAKSIYFQVDQSVYLTSSAGILTLTGSFVVADVTNDNYVKITNNSGGRAPTASVYELYPDAGAWKANTNGVEFNIPMAGACTALASDGAATALTVGVTNCYTLTVDDNEDQTITFSGAGYAGQEVTIIFTTAGSADEIITFHATLVSSTGTLTLGTNAGKFYTIRFISNGSHWYEVSRTGEQT